jgi:hypothetical protein
MSVLRTIEALLVPTTATSQHRRDAIVPEGWQPPSFENAMSNSQEQSQIHPAAPATGTQLLKSTGGIRVGPQWTTWTLSGKRSPDSIYT